MAIPTNINECNPYCPYRKYYKEKDKFECRYASDGKINCYYEEDI